MLTPQGPYGLPQRWEAVRRKLPAVNLVIAGHPLHAILTDLPAALIPTGFLFSCLGRWRREPALESAGFATATAGVAAAGATALAGLARQPPIGGSGTPPETRLPHGPLQLPPPAP